MEKNILTIVLMMAFGALSFNVNAQQHDHAGMDMDHAMPMTKSFQVDKTFQEQLNKVFQSDLKLNEAFMADNMKEVIGAAENTYNLIGKVDMTLVKDKAHMDWMKYEKTMKDALQIIIKATSIEEQRKYFADYNSGLYQSIKAFGIGQQAFYQYCPMANGNEGAYWLSGVEEIQNPYMGSKMPKCGSVKEKLN